MVQQEEATRESFKNLKWTRVIALSQYESHSTNAYDMAPDIIAEHQAMADIAADDLPTIPAYFDPMAFQEANPELKLISY